MRQKRKIIIVVLIIMVIIIGFFLPIQISLRANLPLKIKDSAYSYDDYFYEFDNQPDKYGIYRWGYVKPSYRLSGEAYLYGYDSDKEEKCAFNATTWKLFFRDDKGYPNTSENVVQSVVFSQKNCGEVEMKWVYNIIDYETKVWLTDKKEIEKFLRFIKDVNNSALVPISNVEETAFIRIIYDDSPVYEVIGRLYRTKNEQYYFLPYGSGAFNEYIGIPIDISEYGNLPEAHFWNN